MAGRWSWRLRGGVDEKTLAAVAGTGVARVSVGALTKHVRAVDFSLQFVE